MKNNQFRNGFMSAVTMFVGIIVIGMAVKSCIPSVREAFVIESEYSSLDSEHSVVLSEESALPETSSESDIININTATRRELQKLNGIGEVTAQAIIDYRNEHGFFASVDDLVNVNGIGEKTLEKIRDKITV